MTERRAVFLDRDGTLIRDAGYLADPAQVELLPKAIAGLELLRARGLPLIVVSNQSGVGRGMFTSAALEQVHRRMVELLAEHQVALDQAYYCVHAPWDGCACRKPLPGLIQQAARELAIDLRRSFMIGDKASDIAAGRRAGCRTILIGGSAAESQHRVEPAPDYVAPHLLAAASWVDDQLATCECMTNR
jgi:D-glycero-D-manno-heptose 1,7-bisphosphate phosphatase